MSKIKNGVVKSLSYSMISNLVSLIISTIVITIIPKIVDVSGYGYFQLYIFYSNYIGFFHLGWCDGIYLRHGGEYYDDLDKKQMSSQFWLLTIFETLISVVLLMLLYFSAVEETKRIILYLTVFSIIIVIPKTMLAYVLQMTNKIKENSIITMVEKVAYCAFVLLFVFARKDNFYYYIAADLLGKTAALVIAIVFCRAIVFSKLSNIFTSIKEAANNINVGSKLMVANIAGMLILGIIRLAIENHWNIETFGKVSLSISVSNMMLVFINAIAIVLFPLIKRMDSDKVNSMYGLLNNSLMIVMFLILAAYYPLKELLLLWLPEYSQSFEYMILLFPMCVYECKMSLLVSTYLKAYRKEKIMMYANVVTVLLSLLCAWIFVYCLNSIELSIFSLFCLFAFRCTISELALFKYMDSKLSWDLLLEFLISLAFIALFYFWDNIFAVIIYLVIVGLYIFHKRDIINHIIQVLRNTVQTN